MHGTNDAPLHHRREPRKMPHIIAAFHAMTSGWPCTRFTSAGPGHAPPIPQCSLGMAVSQARAHGNLSRHTVVFAFDDAPDNA